MSISATGFSNTVQWRSPATTPPQAKSVFTPTAASQDSASGAAASGTSASDSSVDGIQVNLPNGLSVGVFRISQAPGGAQQGATTAAAAGNSAASATQMLQAVEQLVAAFADAPGAAANGTASANPESLPSAANLAPGQSMDGMDVELPNGYSADVYHIDQAGAGGGTEDQMIDTMEQLVANLSQYPATAAGAYGKTAAGASPAAANVSSVA